MLLEQPLPLGAVVGVPRCRVFATRSLKAGGYARVPDMTIDRTSFHVAFDEKWQGDFESLADAVEWAEVVSRTTGRMTWVVERMEGNRSVACRLRTTFPEERREEAGEIWLQSRTFPPPPRSPS